MAPFKLKFRMGSSRSTSQEVDSDPHVNQSLLGSNNNNNNNNNINYCNNNLDIGASNSTIDSVDCQNLYAIEQNERKALLPNTTNEKLGYTNPIITHNSDSTSVDGNSPPPSYEQAIKDNYLGNLDLRSRLIITTEIITSPSLAEKSDAINGELINIDEEETTTSEITTQQILQPIDRILSNNLNHKNSNTLLLTLNTNIKDLTGTGIGQNILNSNQNITNQQSNKLVLCDNNKIDGINRKESVDSTEYLISTMTATPPSSQENLLLTNNDDECTSLCEPLFRSTAAAVTAAASSVASSSSVTVTAEDNHEQLQYHQDEQQNQQQQQQQHEYDDSVIDGTSTVCIDDIDGNSSYENDIPYCTGENDQDCPSYIAEMNELEKNRANCNHINSNDIETYLHNNYYGDEDDDDNWDVNLQHIPNEQLQQFISNKSSKKIYKAVAKQWGITCKMSDQCRCMDCQSKYFDCEYDQNEHHKTDGGLAAGTPMFISEVMHGTACTIL